MTSRRSILACLALVAAGSLPLGGCSTASKYRANLTPDLKTLYQREDDIRNAMAIMSDENGRMLNQDLGRAFYTDRPSRLTREPIPR